MTQCCKWLLVAPIVRMEIFKCILIVVARAGFVWQNILRQIRWVYLRSQQWGAQWLKLLQLVTKFSQRAQVLYFKTLCDRGTCGRRWPGHYAKSLEFSYTYNSRSSCHTAPIICMVKHYKILLHGVITEPLLYFEISVNLQILITCNLKVVPHSDYPW